MAYGRLAGVLVVGATLGVGCGSSSGSDLLNGNSKGGGGGSGGSLVLPVGGEPGNDGGTRPGQPAPGTLPPGFSKANVGGYKLGAPITDDGGSEGGASSDGQGCGTVIRAVIRDFKSDHPDFEKAVASEMGLVKTELGSDRKPVFAHDGATKTVSGPTSFDQWYRNVKGVNLPFVFEVFFAPQNGTTSFQSDAFFPLDGKGFGNEGNNHNFHFTTEIHTQFRYRGKEVFNFTGDDDVWIFINRHLVVDLGGVHGAQSAKLEVDKEAGGAGIEVGNVYDFDMFQAERHTTESNFRADTNLEFVDCGVIVPEVPK